MEKHKIKDALKKWYVWVIAIFIAFIIVAIFDDTSTTPVSSNTNEISEKKQTDNKKEEPKEEILEIDYNTLYQEYQDNAIGADAKYKGKMLKLTGAVYDINREIMGNPYVTIKTGEKYSYDNIRLTFKKSEEEKIAQLSKGQTITIKGKCQGVMVTKTVSLNDCEIIE